MFHSIEFKSTCCISDHNLQKPYLRGLVKIKINKKYKIVIPEILAWILFKKQKPKVMEKRKLIEYIRSNYTDYTSADLNSYSFEQLKELKETVELRNLNCFSMKAMDAIFNSVSLI